jgi:signal transduction histidine kinase
VTQISVEDVFRSAVEQVARARSSTTGRAAAASNGDGSPLPNWTSEQIDEVRGLFLREISQHTDSIDAAELVQVLIDFEDEAKKAVRATAARTQTPPFGAPAIDSFSALTEVAHDMRSPLTSILFLVDTILRGTSGRVSPDQERQLRLVYSAAWGLSSLAADVVDVARGHRLLEGAPAPFSITETIIGVCDIIRPIAEEKSLSIHFVRPLLDARLGYSSALARVLLNLATNAVNHTDSGSITVGCTEGDRQCVTFWVLDTGRGMRPVNGDAAPVRAPMHGDRPVTFTSSGLGLMICRNLLTAMNSELRHEPVSGGGTRFWFDLDLPCV